MSTRRGKREAATLESREVATREEREAATLGSREVATRGKREAATLVKLQNISVGYDGREVLAGVSFDIYDSDFLCITGPNGGGKTTLLKTILGLIPHMGTVEYDKSLLINGIQHIGYLPQQNIFDRSFPISVIDVVVSGLQIRRRFCGRRYSRADFAMARKLLKMTGIAEIESRPIGEISGGQMQRALLCRALISRPRLLILDEPATYIDHNFESELLELLGRLNSGASVNGGTHDNGGSGTAIVMVSHDPTALAGLANRIIRVDGGAHELPTS